MDLSLPKKSAPEILENNLPSTKENIVDWDDNESTRSYGDEDSQQYLNTDQDQHESVTENHDKPCQGDEKVSDIDTDVKMERDDENIDAFQQKPRNCSLKQAAVTGFFMKSEDILDVNTDVKMEPGDGPQPVKCDRCSFVCMDESFMMIHKLMHSYTKTLEDEKLNTSNQNKDENDDKKPADGKPFMCDVCNKTFTVKSSLNQHMRLHTGNTSHRCHVCDRPFSQKSHLVRHLKTHTGEKKHKCELCDYATSEINNLMCHMRKHTNERPFPCDLCDAAFKQKVGLIRHRKRHFGIKPFQCTLCDYGCYDSNRLVRHMRIHTGEKPYKCPDCDYTTANNTNLVSHRLKHSGEMPFKCDHCGKMFRRRGDMRKHIRRGHPGLPVPPPIVNTRTSIPLSLVPFPDKVSSVDKIKTEVAFPGDSGDSFQDKDPVSDEAEDLTINKDNKELFPDKIDELLPNKSEVVFPDRGEVLFPERIGDPPKLKQDKEIPVC